MFNPPVSGTIVLLLLYVIIIYVAEWQTKHFSNHILIYFHLSASLPFAAHVKRASSV